MTRLSPGSMIALGLFLAVLGVALPLFMLLKMIPTTFALSFLAYGASFGGLMLGFVGSVMYARVKHRPDDE